MKLADSIVALLYCSTLAGCALPSGLTRSRWAMEDPEYAEKYAQGAEKTDLPGKLKQASDARFQSGTGGWFLSGGAYSRPDTDKVLAGIDIGIESYVTSYLTTRGSLVLMANEDDHFTGIDVGMRIQSPSRLAPFVGAGAFVSHAKEVVPASNDWIDNDDDGFTDEWGEDKERISGMLAGIYPELGSHFWWTPSIRMTGFSRYMVTTEGRADDDWLIGGGIAFFAK
jgi:hypothetical protein